MGRSPLERRSACRTRTKRRNAGKGPVHWTPEKDAGLHSATYRSAPAWDAPSVRGRGSGLGLAVAVTLVIILVLFGAGASQNRPKMPGTALVVDLLPAPEERAAPTTEIAKTEPSPRPQAAPPKPPLTVPRPLDMLVLTREEYAAADISKLARAPGSTRGADNDSKAVGRAPNGEILYSAEWARRPTDVELSGYFRAMRRRAGAWWPAVRLPGIASRIASSSKIIPPVQGWLARFARQPGNSGSGRPARTAANWSAPGSRSASSICAGPAK